MESRVESLFDRSQSALCSHGWYLAGMVVVTCAWGVMVTETVCCMSCRGEWLAECGAGRYTKVPLIATVVRGGAGGFAAQCRTLARNRPKR